MKELFLTSTQPKHFYKSAKYFRDYLALRSTSFFGRLDGRNASFTKKLLMFKKMLKWYYSVPSQRFFKKLFQKSFLKKRISFRSLLGFFQVLERNLLVLCVRSRFCHSFTEGLFLIRGGFVFVNGVPITFPAYFSQIGDTVEVIQGQKNFILHYRNLLFFAEGLFVFRINYFLAYVNDWFLQKPKNLSINQKTFFANKRYQHFLVYLKIK